MQNISLEAGGQLELSGAPVETLHQTFGEINSHLYQVMLSLTIWYNYCQDYIYVLDKSYYVLLYSSLIHGFIFIICRHVIV